MFGVIVRWDFLQYDSVCSVSTASWLIFKIGRDESLTAGEDRYSVFFKAKILHRVFQEPFSPRRMSRAKCSCRVQVSFQIKSKSQLCF